MVSGRHSTGGRRWWRPARSEAYSGRTTLVQPEPPTVPYGLPAIPVQPSADDNARWLLQKLSSDRTEAYDFIAALGLDEAFLKWRQQR